MKKEQIKTGEFWSNETISKDIPSQKVLKIRWWQSQLIVQYINRLVCGENVTGLSQGLNKMTKDLYGNKLPFKKGISVGAGNGIKEMNLLKQGIVESFDLYEFSESRIISGIELAKKQNLENRIKFIRGDAFNLVKKTNQYDFVHWNNSLHHMLNVEEAIKWSRKVLKDGGLFYMDDFIGASRFQWSDEQLKIANKVRNIFSKSKYLSNPRSEGKFLPIEIKKPDIEKLINIDSSEAAESDKIIDTIIKYFPNAEIKKTGGVIYHLVLSNMLDNFDEINDKILLNLLLVIDELCIDLGESQYGVALAIKEKI